MVINQEHDAAMAAGAEPRTEKPKKFSTEAFLDLYLKEKKKPLDEEAFKFSKEDDSLDPVPGCSTTNLPDSSIDFHLRTAEKCYGCALKDWKIENLKEENITFKDQIQNPKLSTRYEL